MAGFYILNGEDDNVLCFEKCLDPLKGWGFHPEDQPEMESQTQLWQSQNHSAQDNDDELVLII